MFELVLVVPLDRHWQWYLDSCVNLTLPTGRQAQSREGHLLNYSSTNPH